jgi:AcrR family transcriptional regulator
MPAKPSQRRRPEARPDEILDAALEVFSKAGFSAAKVETVARQAGLSKGAVYLYFPSKEAMLTALVERSVGALAKKGQQMVAAMAAHEPIQTYRLLLRTMLTEMSDPKINAAPRLVFAEAGRLPELARYYRETVIDIGREAIRQLLEAGVARGEFRDINVEAAMRSMAGPAIAHMMLSTLFSHPDDPAIDPAKLADEISDIVLNGIRPRIERPIPDLPMKDT